MIEGSADVALHGLLLSAGTSNLYPHAGAVMGLKQITANPTVQAVAAVLLAALSVVGVSSVRGTLGVSADPTTRHGEIAVRVDAGGADVTALAPIDPGTPTQVLTVSDSGVPVWRDPSGGTVTASQISDSTTTGRALLTAATAAAARAVVWPYPIAMLAGGLDGSGPRSAHRPQDRPRRSRAGRSRSRWRRSRATGPHRPARPARRARFGRSRTTR